jgi:predicted sulfurtransferase
MADDNSRPAFKNSGSSEESIDSPHKAIVLFYKYFDPSKYPLLSASNQHAEFYERRLMCFQRELCNKLSLKGRIAIAREGINGTLSATSQQVLRQFIECMENFELIRDVGFPPSTYVASVDGDIGNGEGSPPPATLLQAASYPPHFLFSGIDWKESSTQNAQNQEGAYTLEPFPDMKVAVVTEIIASGSKISAEDIANHGGTHMSPREFQKAMIENPNAVLVDVRNTFEYNIGHFFHPITHASAINPHTTVFSTFDSVFCKRQAESLRDKKVLMYCTGGIRCEKASTMLRLRGVKDVCQLKGGIHRYLEEFGGGPDSAFRGLNFVFDQRVAVKPSECKSAVDLADAHGDVIESQAPIEVDTASLNVIGKCFDCGEPYEVYCGSRICSVCRDLVLACLKCQARLFEYHCQRHQAWRDCYFTFLERFDASELQQQKQCLEGLVTSASSRNVRKTLKRQIQKIGDHLRELDAGLISVDRDAPRRCRSCFEPSTACDGRCWGFWKVS